MNLKKLTTIATCAGLMMSISLFTGCNSSSDKDDKAEATNAAATDNAGDDNTQTTYDPSKESTDEEVIECVEKAATDALADEEIAAEMGEEGYVIFQNGNDVKSIKYDLLSDKLVEEMTELDFNAPKEEGKVAYELSWSKSDDGNITATVTTVTADELVAITDAEASAAQAEDEKVVNKMKEEEGLTDSEDESDSTDTTESDSADTSASE